MFVVLKWTSILLLIIADSADIGSSPIEVEKPRIFGKCISIPEVISSLYYYLPSQMSPEEKCKRYAVLSVVIETKNLPTRLNVLKLSELNEDMLEDLHSKINVNDLINFYMTAIDSYRSSQLEPPLLELVDCLKQIDLPEVATYLDCPELNLTLELYKQVLAAPDKRIDKNLEEINRPFATIIKYLFKDYLQDGGSSDEEKVHIRHAEHIASTSEANHKQVQVELLSGNRNYKQRREGACERKKNVRLANSIRHRERERLRKRRLRILHPEVLRERGRLWEKKRRDRRREQQQEKQLRSMIEMQTRIQQYRQQQEHQQQIKSLREDLQVPEQSSEPAPETVYVSMNLAKPQHPQRQPDHVTANDLLQLSSLEIPSMDTSPRLEQQLLQQNLLQKVQRPLRYHQSINGSSMFTEQSQDRLSALLQKQLVKPMTHIPSFATHMELLAAPSSPLGIYPTLDQPMQHEELTKHEQTKIDNLVQAYSSRDDKDFCSDQSYNYIIGSEAEDDSIMSIFTSFDRYGQPSQFDDTDAVMRSFTDTKESD